MKIIGVVYSGDKGQKYTQDSDIKNGKWTSTNPQLIAPYMRLDNKEVSSQFIVRQIEYDSATKTPYPRIFNVQEAENWQISTNDHTQVASYMKMATYLNLFGNLFFWLYL